MLNKNEQKVIAFYINHGVEARHFVLSSLVNKMENEGNKVVFLFKSNINSDLRRQFFPDQKIIFFPDEILLKKRYWIEGYISAIRKARMNFKKVGLFHNFNDPKAPSLLRDFFLGNWVVHNIITLFAKVLYKKYYTDKAIVDFLLKNEIDELYFLDYNADFQLQLGFSANNANISLNVCINTLKSFYINNFIPFKVNKIYVWSKVQKLLFQKFNTNLNSKNTIDSGCFFHHFLLHDKTNFEPSQQLIELTKEPYVLYSLIFQTIYPNEYYLIENLEKTLIKLFPDNTPKIIIRRNPFENSNFDIEQIRKLKNVKIAPHSWERDESKSWSIQSMQGEYEWKYLLKNAKVLINISSMASIEALLLGTPVINLGLNKDGIKDITLRRFYNAPFMSEILKSKFSGLALNQNDLENQLLSFIDVKKQFTDIDVQNSLNISKTNFDKMTII